MKTVKMGQPPSKPKDLKEKFNLSQKQYDDLKHTFEEHSKGKKGISKTQFRKVYSSRFPGNVSSYADKMFDCFDTDGNGHVDFGEFVTGICLMDSNNIEDRIGIAFTLFDQDKSGFIDRHEVRELLSAYNNLYGANTINVEKVADQLFNKMDTNNDNEISKDEFIAAVHRIPELLKLIRPELV